MVKIAMLHYQFETIHPFVKGNGRIGRMLVPLYMQSKGLLEKSCLYISSYLEKNKTTYFEKLTNVRKSSDITGWIGFFLEVIQETAKSEKEKLKRLETLEKEINQIASELPVKEESGKKVMEVLYETPIATRKEILERSKAKSSTINTTINSLVEKGAIEEITGQGRNQIFAFRRYIDIFMK